MSEIQELYEKRAALVKQMQELSVGAAKEGRAMTTEEDTKWTKIEADEAALTRSIDAYEKTQKLAESRAKAQGEGVTDASGRIWTSNSTNPDEERAAQYRVAYSNFIKRGMKGLTPEQRQMVETRGTNTQIAGTDSLGGYGVPDFWQAGIEKAMLDYSGILQAADIVRTDGGNTLFFLTEDDTSTAALLVAESGAFTVQDVTYGQKQLDAYKYGTLVKYSYELAQDNTYNLEADLQATFATRFGRAMNTSGTTGTGSSQPNGVVTASTLGKTTASATAFTFNEVVDFIHSIDPAYRASSKFGLMFHDNILAAIKKLSVGSSDARPLWQPSVVQGAPDKIEGYQYWINQGMESAITTGKKIMLAGDFSKFKIRIAQDMRVLRLDELYANNGHVGFQAWMRWDSECMNTSAIKHMITA